MKGNIVILGPKQRLIGVQKEWHARKQGGKSVAYIAIDRCGEWDVVLTQKLPLLAKWISSQANGKGEQVSTTALYLGAPKFQDFFHLKTFT